jgi:glutamate/tyrosine decarboxylase-like PLP-dependent enzyme
MQLSAALPSPISTGIENSRRLRALPLFAALNCLGASGYNDIFVRHVEFARAVAAYLRASDDWDVLTPPEMAIMTIVLFAPAAACRNVEMRGEDGSARALQRIKDSRRVYCSGTRWRGRPAIRLAVSNVGLPSSAAERLADGEW